MTATPPSRGASGAGATHPTPLPASPPSVGKLEKYVLAYATAEGFAVGRVRHWISFMMLSGALDEAARRPGGPRFIVKGGVALELRLPGRARATDDLDVVVVCEEPDLVAALDAALRDGYGDCTFTRRADVYPLGDKGVRVSVQVAYRTQRWATVQVDLAHPDAADTETERLGGIPLARFGLRGPSDVPCLSLRYHIAQKWHGLTRMPPNGGPNERFRDAVDLLILHRLIEPDELPAVREACEETFRSRAEHSWPPPIALPPHWEEPFRSMALGLGLTTTSLEDAESELRSLLDAIRSATHASGLTATRILDQPVGLTHEGQIHHPAHEMTRTTRPATTKTPKSTRAVTPLNDAPDTSAPDSDLATGPAVEETDGDEQDLVPEGKLVCALTGEHRTATPQEETLQSFIEQLHREYDVALEDMARDVRVSCVRYDENKGKDRSSNRNVSLLVYEPGTTHVPANVTHVAIVAKPGTKSDKKAIEVLDDVLAAVAEDRPMVFGLWTNGTELQFRLRTWNKRTGYYEYAYLADFPGPGERLEDLENADRRPLRVASGDSLLRAFKRCHDYLYGNQSMRGDRAFWQLLNLIFCKIHDESQSRRKFFVGATEPYDTTGQKAIARRIHSLFEEVKGGAYKDVFDGTEKIELNDRALAYVAGEISRYSLLSTDTDAKGMAYEAITSTTLKRERGQFFTPRNVIQMMVEMADPQPGQRILDPACGSGGFLVVALAHHRARLLEKLGVPRGAPAVPRELKAIEKDLKRYARESLYGLDVDPDLRKAARMNMVMNNDGHGNIFEMNSLEFSVPGKDVDAWAAFKKVGGGHGQFDYVFTNPPFGSKIPVSDTEVLQRFDLGHQWTRTRDGWQKGKLQKKVSPEILFIEACWRFLRPGTGVMAIVLPNGILGNPGEQMEAVRRWMLQNMELLASVDLPAEAFLPQVSVQASCVLLRRRHPDELRLIGENGLTQAPVFMAIADACGHGRRGETTWARQPDGTERIEMREVLERWERNGELHERVRQRKERILADDMPWVAWQYKRFRDGNMVGAE